MTDTKLYAVVKNADEDELSVTLFKDKDSAKKFIYDDVDKTKEMCADEDGDEGDFEVYDEMEENNNVRIDNGGYVIDWTIVETKFEC